MAEETEKKEVKTTKKVKRKRINWTKLGIVIVIVAFILIFLWPGGILLSEPGQATRYVNTSYDVFVGDQIIDTGSGNIREGTLSGSIGFISDKLDQEITNMQPGEDKNITLTATEAFGTCDSSNNFEYDRKQEIEREQDINRTRNVTLAIFTQMFEEEPEVGEVYETPLAEWKYKVLEIFDNELTLSIETELGKEFPAGYYGVLKVKTITDDKITLRLEGEDSIVPSEVGNIEIEFKEDVVVSTLTPEIGAEIQLPNLPKARVIELTEDTIKLTTNHQYCDQEVIVSIKVLGRSTQTTSTGGPIQHIEGAPTLEFYIMSYCPYGLQMLKGVLPVWKQFQSHANIELRFVNYILHGQEEQDENARMTCIREEQSDKLIDYLTCFVENGDYERCMVQTGVDSAEVESCIDERYDTYFVEDNARNEQYGVKGSPTVVLNGEVIELWPRSPSNVAKAICDAFDSKPDVCDLTFSEENPTAGFGGSTGGSGGSGGSC
ncbi:MAG: hypothetical protein JSW08_00865 [archaeon]|nr:MAG: hypothetical protein JSW08_00865 [archaeon]